MSELRTVEAFVVGAVKDVEVLRDIPGCPLDAAAVEHLLANCPAYVINPTNETPNYLQYTEPRPSGLTDMPGLWLWRPGPAHNRSFCLSGPGLDEPWCDEYGNRYGAFTLKGINFTNPGIMEHPPRPRCEGPGMGLHRSPPRGFVGRVE